MEYEIHEANIFPLMDDDGLDSLANSIKERGLERPIALFEGKILDGQNRYMACLRCGVKPVFESIDTDDPWGYVWAHNGERRHLSPEKRRALAKECLRKHPEESNRSIAAKAGIHHTTVGSYREALESIGEISQLDEVRQKDGSSYPLKRKTVVRDSHSETTEEPAEVLDKQTGEIKPAKKEKGVGVIRANEAINSLTRIPKNDALRKRGFQLVMDWIKHNS